MSAKTSTEKTSTEKVPGGKNVLVEFEDQIAWVTLNRPEKRNCMSPALNDEMVEVLDALEIDDRCGVLVLTGAGDSFSAGMDLREFFRATDGMPFNKQMRVRRSAANWQWRQLMNFPKPTIAMVNGWCFGGAFRHIAAQSQCGGMSAAGRTGRAASKEGVRVWTPIHDISSPILL